MKEIKAENHSVAAGSITDSTITIGYTQQQYENALREREKVLRQEYVSLAVSLTSEQTEKRVEVERELAVVRNKLDNIETAYAESPRVCRRQSFLRGLADEQTTTRLFT